MTKEQVVGGESPMRLLTATLKEIEDGRLLHAKTCWADVTDLSEESALEVSEKTLLILTRESGAT